MFVLETSKNGESGEGYSSHQSSAFNCCSLELQHPVACDYFRARSRHSKGQRRPWRDRDDVNVTHTRTRGRTPRRPPVRMTLGSPGGRWRWEREWKSEVFTLEGIKHLLHIQIFTSSSYSRTTLLISYHGLFQDSGESGYYYLVPGVSYLSYIVTLFFNVPHDAR